jgi:soluble cytochrome b562
LTAYSAQQAKIQTEITAAQDTLGDIEKRIAELLSHKHKVSKELHDREHRSSVLQAKVTEYRRRLQVHAFNVAILTLAEKTWTIKSFSPSELAAWYVFIALSPSYDVLDNQHAIHRDPCLCLFHFAIALMFSPAAPKSLAPLAQSSEESFVNTIFTLNCLPLPIPQNLLTRTTALRTPMGRRGRTLQAPHHSDALAK